MNTGKKNEGIFCVFFVSSADRVKRYRVILLAAICRPSALTFVVWFMQKLLYKKSVPQKRVVAPNNGSLPFKPPFGGHHLDSLRVFLNVMYPIFYQSLHGHEDRKSGKNDLIWQTFVIKILTYRW
jgi:hypothetical protein